MKEATLWEHLKPELKKLGKFQKVCDRFTPGIPDILGCGNGIPYALELKELKGVQLLKAHFRPGQIDWLKDWVARGGVGLVVTSHGSQVMVFSPASAIHLEEGVSYTWAAKASMASFLKTRNNKWSDFVVCLRSISHEQIQRADQRASKSG